MAPLRADDRRYLEERLSMDDDRLSMIEERESMEERGSMDSIPGGAFEALLEGVAGCDQDERLSMERSSLEERASLEEATVPGDRARKRRNSGGGRERGSSQPARRTSAKGLAGLCDPETVRLFGRLRKQEESEGSFVKRAVELLECFGIVQKVAEAMELSTGTQANLTLDAFHIASSLVRQMSVADLAEPLVVATCRVLLGDTSDEAVKLAYARMLPEQTEGVELGIDAETFRSRLPLLLIGEATSDALEKLYSFAEPSAETGKIGLQGFGLCLKEIQRRSCKAEKEDDEEVKSQKSVDSKATVQSTYSTMSKAWAGFGAGNNFFFSMFKSKPKDTGPAVTAAVIVEEEHEDTKEENLGEDEELAPATRKMVRRLSMELSSEDVIIKANAVERLKTMESSQASEVSKALAPQLQSSDPTLRAVALRTLGNMGQISTPYLEHFSEACADNDRGVQLAGAVALGSLGEAGAQRLVLLLKHTEPSVREVAVHELGIFPQYASAVSQLLWDEVASVRGNAILTLGKMGEPGFRQYEKVAKLLADSEAEVQKLATRFLANACGKEGGAGAAACAVGLLRNEDATARLVALRGLHSLHLADQHIDSIATLVSDTDPKVQQLASDITTAICEANRALGVSLLRHHDAGARRIATTAVCAMGEEGVAHADALGRMLRDSDPRTRSMAVTALGRMGPKVDRFAGDVARLLHDEKDASVLAAGAAAMGHFGKAARAHGKELVDLLGHTDQQVRVAAAAVVQGWAVEDKEAKEKTEKK
eukprot:TRINITY_DN26980_c0_g1_i1.p1 TRINITY_DN26980_c0_g1~~TRINITY_DN26980_c0_g1_i1.p1  ORF type:complete len:786 (-),score=239.44 TRINITY_DN26980_c0_g1_i1:504-2807(-)